MAALTSNGVGTCGADDNQAQAGHLIPWGGAFHMTQDPISSETHTPVLSANASVGVMYSIMPMNSNTDYKAREVEVAQPLMTAPTGGNQGGDYIVQPLAIRGREGGAELEAGAAGAPYNALRAGDGGSSRQSLISVQRHAETIVRRLTEMECERLQGYPDGWTEGQSASARYRQLGNSVAVPVVEWIARRLVVTDGNT